MQRVPFPPQTEKPERLEARLSRMLKQRLQYAATLQGSSLSEFILRSAEKEANTVISNQRILQLSFEDTQAFIETLFTPPEPNHALKIAYRRYKKEVTSQ